MTLDEMRDEYERELAAYLKLPQAPAMFKAARSDDRYYANCIGSDATRGQLEIGWWAWQAMAKGCEKLKAESEAQIAELRKALTYIRDTSDDWHVCEKAADALVDAGGDIPDFTPGNGNKARRRAEALGVDHDAAMRNVGKAVSVKRTRVFRSPCCGVVSGVGQKYPGEPISLAQCYKCHIVYDSSGLKSWLQDLLLLPLGSSVPEELIK